MGVDCSTQSTKVEVRDLDDGTVVATGRAPHPPARPPCSEQDPHAWWTALRDAVADAGCPEVDALSVAAQQHGMVVADAAGAVLRPAKLWNDTTSAPQAARLVEDLGAERWVELTGSVPTAAFTVSKLAWLADEEPATVERIGAVGLPHDHLNLRLTGRLVTDRGDASGTGYYDPANDTWLVDLLDRFVAPGPWAERLPEVAGPTEAAGPLTPGAAEFLGLAPGALVGPGTGDNMAAALGIGLGPGQVALSLGTSGTVYTRSPTATADPTGTVAGFAAATGDHLPLVCTLNATKVTDAFARLLGVDADGLADLASRQPPGAAGLTLVPYLDGERTPNRPDATGTLTGLRADVTRAAVARAAHEGVVCGLLDGLDVLAGHAPVVDGGLVLVGGGARSAAYRRVVADLSGRTVTVPADAELVATGAAVQAAAVLAGTSLDAVQQAWSLGTGQVVEPDPTVDAAAVRDAYRAAARAAASDPSA